MLGHDLDRDLDRLRTAADRISANLLELEQDPNVALIEAAGLRGDSERCWHGGRSALADVFELRDKLMALLASAAELRGSRPTMPADRMAALARLLYEPSIELSDRTVPLADRDLLASSHVVERCTPDELLVRMSSAFDRARAPLVSVCAVWDALVPRVKASRERVRTAMALAEGVGEGAQPRLAALDRGLGEIAEAVLADPLSVDPRRLDVIESELDLVSLELRDLEELRADFAARIDQARLHLEEVQRTMRGAEEARRESAAKVAGPLAAPDPDGLASALAADLAGVRDMARRDEWQAVHLELVRWHTSADELLRHARGAEAAAQAALERRRRLRGRLDAYRAKAAQLGHLEDLERLHDQARTALYTAPTDLVLAAELVRRYQEAVSAAVPAEGR